MRGSLEQPPLVIARSRLSVLPYALVSLAILTPLCAGMRAGEITSGWLAWSLVAASAAASLYFVRQLVRPDYIAITRDGLYSQNWLRLRRFAWRDISKFTAHDLRSVRGRWITLVGFSPVAALGRPSTRQQLNMVIWGDTDVMAGPWEIPHEQVEWSLNEARRRWGGWTVEPQSPPTYVPAPRGLVIALLAVSFVVIMLGGALGYLQWKRSAAHAPAAPGDYPARAAQAGVEGRVILTCRVAVGFRLENCAIASETPAGYGFGAAALRIASRSRLPPKDRLGARPGRSVNFPVVFRTPPTQ